ncbi:MAG: hypothetical protein ABFD69_01820 [Candidatus Sumerlaeia bacterium]
MRFTKILLASLFLAALIAVPIYAQMSATPKADTCAQCDGNCKDCPNTDCAKNPNCKGAVAMADNGGCCGKGGDQKSGCDKGGCGKAGDQKGGDQKSGCDKGGCGKAGAEKK